MPDRAQASSVERVGVTADGWVTFGGTAATALVAYTAAAWQIRRAERRAGRVDTLDAIVAVGDMARSVDQQPGHEGWSGSQVYRARLVIPPGPLRNDAELIICLSYQVITARTHLNSVRRSHPFWFDPERDDFTAPLPPGFEDSQQLLDDAHAALVGKKRKLKDALKKLENDVAHMFPSHQPTRHRRLALSWFSSKLRSR